VTIAVCIKCGQRKFGAFTLCERCSFEPSNVLELAKSIYLSDHNFPMDQLDAFALTIAVGEPVEYDPIALTIISAPISQEQYYEKSRDFSGQLPCMRCGVTFRAQDRDAICPDCEQLLNCPISMCNSCMLAFDGAVKFCSLCGQRINTAGSVSPIVLAQTAAFHARLLKSNQKILSSSEKLNAAQNRLSAFDKERFELELDILVLYATILVLRDVASSRTYEVVSRVALQIFCDSFLLYGLSPAESQARIQRYVESFDEYDKGLLENANQRMLGLAIIAGTKLFPHEDRPELVFDLVILIGAYIKYSKELLFKKFES